MENHGGNLILRRSQSKRATYIPCGSDYTTRNYRARKRRVVARSWGRGKRLRRVQKMFRAIKLFSMILQ